LRNAIERYRLDVGLVKRHEAGMDRDGHCGEVKVVEEHWQVIVKALRGCEVQLQRPEKELFVKLSSIDHGLIAVVKAAIDQPASRTDVWTEGQSRMDHLSLGSWIIGNCPERFSRIICEDYQNYPKL